MKRVRLIRKYVDKWNQSFEAGQGGNASAELDGEVLVNFDGYDEARKRDAERRARYGEGANIVPWLALVPKNYLEAAE